MTTKEKDRLNIYQRLHAVMEEVDYIQKCQKKMNGQYTFVQADAVVAKLRGPLLKHGIFLVPTITHSSQDGNRTIVNLAVAFVCIDKPEDRFEVEYPGHGVDNQDKGIGKAITYAMKYALLKTFFLETGDEDDNEAHQVEYKPPVVEVAKPATEEDQKEQLLDKFEEKEVPLVDDYIKFLCKKLDKKTKVIVNGALKRLDAFTEGFEKWKITPA